ncbi:AGAP009706-PA-like protein [Anopheles sinensis]|uniref:AGAP009706-PA-like protein n=1 Tax=Anopheles sinensis TaxID=74873 RepID=A0A084WU91_ANOSI|nr:AGAP009706-PA-like protein [Anopheles sinensis]
MATVESYRNLVKLLCISSKIVGVEVWTAPGRFRPASYYLSFHVIVYFVSTIYTLAKYSNDPLHMMKILITLGTAVVLYMKFFIVILRSFEYKSFADLIEEELLKPFENGNAEEVAVLERTGRILWVIGRLMFMCFACSGVFFGIYTVYEYYVNGALVPLFLYELPYYDWSTTGGYVTNMLFQVNLYAIGVIGASFIEFLFIMFALYTLAYVDIFLVHLRELRSLLDDVEFVKKNNGSEIRQKWMECILNHQQALRFLDSIEDLFKLMFLGQVWNGVISLCIGMLLILMTDWYAAYFFVLVIFLDFSFYFLIGHYVELKVDEMYDTINSVPWYKFPIINQKEFIFLLGRQQRPMIMTVYGFAPLNFATYTNLGNN